MAGYNEDLNINDAYGIKKDWNEVKQLVQEIENDFDTFLGFRRVKKRAPGIRRKLSRIKALTKIIAVNVNKTRQDYESDYS